MNSRILVLFVISIIFFSCAEEELGPDLPPVSNILISDNANNGNGSDLEVNFEKQSDETNILEYRVIILKSGSASLSVEEGLELDINRYTRATPDDIFPRRGVTLSANAKDTDGDLIQENENYKVGVITMSVDPILANHSLTLDSKEFFLKENNIITNFTEQIVGGAGSLVLAEDGNMFMASYNIVDHLSLNTQSIFSIFQIDPFGFVTDFSQNHPLIMGNAIDSKGNLYHSLHFEEQILKTDGINSSRIGIDNKLLSSPDGLYVDPNDNLFVVTQDVDHVLKVSSDGDIEIIARIPPKPRGITGDENGNLYVSHNDESGIISKVSPSGEVTELARIPTFKPPSYTIEYLMWVGYITYHNQALYVAGMSTDRIYKVGLDGTVENYVGSGERGIPRGDTRTANLNRPIGLAFNEDGDRLFISVSADIEPRHTQSTTPAQVIQVQIVE